MLKNTAPRQLCCSYCVFRGDVQHLTSSKCMQRHPRYHALSISLVCPNIQENISTFLFLLHYSLVLWSGFSSTFLPSCNKTGQLVKEQQSHKLFQCSHLTTAEHLKITLWSAILYFKFQEVQIWSNHIAFSYLAIPVISVAYFWNCSGCDRRNWKVKLLSLHKKCVSAIIAHGKVQVVC